VPFLITPVPPDHTAVSRSSTFVQPTAQTFFRSTFAQHNPITHYVTMRFSQTALIAILAATVAAKPVLARGDDVKLMEDYKKCCDVRDKEDPKRVCVPPSESDLHVKKG
jgi:hypothetical protein